MPTRQITEQQLGADHPATATSLNHLALLYESQGRCGEAEPLSVRSLEIITTKLGQNHPTTRQGRTNLAMLYDDMAAQFKLQARYDKVVEYLEKAIALRGTQDLRGLHQGRSGKTVQWQHWRRESTDQWQNRDEILGRLLSHV